MNTDFRAVVIVLSIPVLIIAVIILTIKYVYTKAKTVGSEQFRKEAARQASKMKYTSPVITCDYCGYEIDTKKYSNCPNCGASYSRDEEWTGRYGPTEDGINAKADEYADLVKQEKAEQAEAVAGWIRRCLTALGIIFAFLAVLFIAGKLLESQTGHYVTENDELNHYSDDAYVPVPYGIDGDGVLIDKNGVRVTVIGIYKDKNYRDFKIGFRIQNESGQPVHVSVSMDGVNGKTCWLSVYDYYKDHADIIRYEKIRGPGLGDPEICEMVYTDIRVYGEEDNRLHMEVPLLVMKTTSTADCTAKCPDETVIYDDHQVVILCRKEGDEKYRLWIDNRSDVNYVVTTSDLRVNGNDVDTLGGIEKDILPAGYLYQTYEIRAISNENAAAEGAQTEISVSFRSWEDPSKDFSTGYLRLDQ